MYLGFPIFIIPHSGGKVKGFSEFFRILQRETVDTGSIGFYFFAERGAAHDLFFPYIPVCFPPAYACGVLSVPARVAECGSARGGTAFLRVGSSRFAVAAPVGNARGVLLCTPVCAVGTAGVALGWRCLRDRAARTFQIHLVRHFLRLAAGDLLLYLRSAFLPCGCQPRAGGGGAESASLRNIRNAVSSARRRTDSALERDARTADRTAGVAHGVRGRGRSLLLHLGKSCCSETGLRRGIATTAICLPVSRPFSARG